VKLHHFLDCATHREISIHPIQTHNQQADYLTKPVNESKIGKLRGLVQGWYKDCWDVKRECEDTGIGSSQRSKDPMTQ
jgi:hypothetical protein